LLAELADLGHEMMDTVLEGFDAGANERLLSALNVMRDNLRGAIARNANQPQAATVAAQ
jgi:hypothetical protein